MPTTSKEYTRAKLVDSYAGIADLREFYGDGRLGTMLGCLPARFESRRLPIPIVRLAFLLHRLTFVPASEPLTVFEILTAGKFDPTPQEKFAIRAKGHRKANDFPPPLQIE